MFVAVPVSTHVTEVEYMHKVAPVKFDAIFLFVRGGPFAMLKKNIHIVGYLCRIF